MHRPPPTRHVTPSGPPPWQVPHCQPHTPCQLWVGERKRCLIYHPFQERWENNNNSVLSTERILFMASNFHNNLNAKQDVLYL